MSSTPGLGRQQRAASVFAAGLGVTAAAAEQIAVVVSTELATQEVQSQRVDARVDERQTERGDLEDVPEHVVLGRVEVEPEVPDVARQPAYHEDDDERQYETSHFLACLNLDQQQCHVHY